MGITADSDIRMPTRIKPRIVRRSPCTTCIFLDALRAGTFVEDHPGRAELVPEHRKPEGEKGLLHRHENLTAIGKQSINALGLIYGTDCEGKISAAHRLKTVRWNVSSLP